MFVCVGGMRGGAKVTIEPHRHEGKFVVLYYDPYFWLLIHVGSYSLWKGIISFQSCALSLYCRLFHAIRCVRQLRQLNQFNHDGDYYYAVN